MLKRFLIYWFLILGVTNSCYSQSFKWIKQIGDKSGDIIPLCKLLPDGQSLIVWSYADSTQIDNVKTKSLKKTSFNLCLLGKDGKVKWLWKPDSCLIFIGPTGICYSESLGKIFVCGNFNKNATINKVAYKGNNNGFVIRLDTNGTFEKIYILSDTSALNFESIDISPQNDIVIGIHYNNSGSNFKLSIPSLGFSINKRGCFLLKLDKDLRPQKASEPEYGIKVSKFLINTKSKNQILSVCTFMDTLRIGSNFYYNGKNVYSTYISYWDSNLVFKKNSFLFKSMSTANINALKSFPNGSILLAGRYRDSIGLISKKYTNGQHVSLFACLDSNLNLKWAKVPDIRTGERIVSEIMDLEVSGDYIIAGGIFNGNAHYDDFHLPDTSGIFWFFKTDNRGNILWMQRCANSIYGQYVSSISANTQKEILITGYIVDTVKLNKQVFITQKSKPDVLLMKIHDIEIYRGQVSKGPYCAGDTIKIPYTKEGDFNTGNEFIAQLSDEDGNFTGGEHELGRVKSTTDGLIKGLLPLFEVESSPNYRIRILSTNPVVQSYYKYDTLRLLIYSKDKANPGLPETICLGDSIQLKTYGGTKWKWSPKYNMNDSTLKKPWVWPNNTTTYKLIIGDSSGCGKPDTAYKIIKVRQALKVIIAYTDTALCDTTLFKIPVSFTGGDSSNYTWQWYQSPKTLKPIASGKLKLKDTLAYLPKIGLNKNDTIGIVLSDKCTAKNDTAWMILRLIKPSVLTVKFKDMLYCKGKSLSLKSKAQYGQPNDYQWQWLDVTHNAILSTSDVLNTITNTTSQIKLTLSNGCTKDSNAFILKVKPALQIISNLRDTSICYGQNLNLTATAKGGDSTNYKLSWVLNTKEISNTNTLQLIPNHYSNLSNPTLALILTDNCTLPNDTIQKTITLKTLPKADYTTGLTCRNTTTDFTFTGTKTDPPNTHSFIWNFNNEATSVLENPSHTFDTHGKKNVRLIISSSNGCKDTLEKAVDIKTKSKADFNTTDVCQTDSAVFTNLSSDATDYNWKFGDGKTNNLKAPKHKYQITNSTTYNVTLVAIVQDGCSDSITKPITINENPNSEFTFTQTGNSLYLKANKSGLKQYKWVFGNSDSIAKTTHTHTQILQSNQSKVCLSVTDILGCNSQTCSTFTIGIKTINANKIKIYPNPASETITIETIGLENPQINIQLINLLGQVVVEQISNFKSQISISHLPEGMYLVRVISDGKVWNQKVMVSFGESNQ